MHNNHCYLQIKDNFIRWVVEQLGPVLLGAKPAEILSFPQIEEGNLLPLIKSLFNNSSKISYSYFHTPNGCMKILFYNIEALDMVLTDTKNLKFLKDINYPKDYSYRVYIDSLIEKLMAGEMPHEIGIFLGYPLKDVLGFIGHPSLKLTKVNGWCVYGNSKISDIKCQQILQAKERVKEQLKTLDPWQVVRTAS